MFSPPVVAKILRLRTTQFNNHNMLSFELYGYVINETLFTGLNVFETQFAAVMLDIS